MSDRDHYFSRLTSRVDLHAHEHAFIAIVGVGSVGSMMALELARSGVGHLLLIDGDRLETHNLARHALPTGYLSTNKAEATGHYLQANIPGLDIGAVPHHLDDAFTDEEIDRLIAPAHLVIVATDRRSAQRRIAARALAMDIPAVIPGLYADRGGEVFVQLNPGQACFRCWDDFRDPDAEVRSVSSINADALAVIQQAAFLSIAVLDPRSRHARDLAPAPADPRPRQLFVLRPGAALLRTPVTRRPGCIGCGVGPSPIGEDPRPATPAGSAGGAFIMRHTRRAAAGWRFTLADEPADPKIEHVGVSEPIVAEGSHVTLAWRTRNSTHVLIDGHGAHPPEGELTVLVEKTTAFKLTAVNPYADTSATSEVVRVIALPRIRELRLVALPTAQLGGAQLQAWPPVGAHAIGAPRKLPRLPAPQVIQPPTLTAVRSLRRRRRKP
jgi:molybdopterin/thiamine biosynthesis adenylyltransferase